MKRMLLLAPAAAAAVIVPPARQAQARNGAEPCAPEAYAGHGTGVKAP